MADDNQFTKRGKYTQCLSERRVSKTFRYKVIIIQERDWKEDLIKLKRDSPCFRCEICGICLSVELAD